MKASVTHDQDDRIGRHRSWLVCHGCPRDTAQAAIDALRQVPPDAVLWISALPPDESFVHVHPHRASTLLGRSFAAVVLDYHVFFEPNLLGQAHGFVWGGGRLILRCPDPAEAPSQQRSKLHIQGYSVEGQPLRFYRRFWQVLERHHSPPVQPWNDAFQRVKGTVEQEELVQALVTQLSGTCPSTTVLVADRGRGKSAALGMVARALLNAERNVIVSAGHPDAVDAVFRHVGPGHDTQLAFTSIDELAYGAHTPDVLLIDEAAQVPVPVLQRIVYRYPEAHCVFATTARGYEGSGRGFTLRFVEWLRTVKNTVSELGLSEPIRWSAGDPLESMVFDALLLDAQYAEPDEPDPDARVQCRRLDRDELVRDELQLRAFFGLLIQAHYRTTPSDVQLLLDGPNIELHALYENAVPVAATMVAREGGLPVELARDLYWGRTRIRGHALPETLLSHSGHLEAGSMNMIRSVRIAVHPSRRRQGYASALVDHVHHFYEPDLFGTLFGTTAGLLTFRRQVGYRLVRVGASRGTRTGEPAAVMIRPVSTRAKRLVETLRVALARELPEQLALMQSGHELLLSDDLHSSLLYGLPEPIPLTEDEVCLRVARFAFGPSTQEAVASALRRFVTGHQSLLEYLPHDADRLIRCRIVDGGSWADTMAAAGLPSIPATMRALRRAVRAFCAVADPDLASKTGVPITNT